MSRKTNTIAALGVSIPVLGAAVVVPIAAVVVVALVMVNAIAGIGGALYQVTNEENVCAPGTTNSPTSLSGNGLEQKTWNFLTGAGFTDEQAAGVMGNIHRESGFNPFIAENSTSDPDTSRGWGLVQWTAGRHIAIRDAVLAEPSLGDRFYVASSSGAPSGMSDDDVDALLLFQLQYIVDELNGAEGAAGRSLRAATTVEEATTVFERDYERAGVVALEERTSAAKGYYEQFSGTSASASTDSDSSDADAAATSNQFSEMLGYSQEAIGRADEIAQITKDLGYSDQAGVLAITAAMTQSDLGDADSMNKVSGGRTGLYGMYVEEGGDYYHGTAEEARDTDWATKMFLNGGFTSSGDMKGLSDVDGWETMAPQQALYQVLEAQDSYAGNYEDAKEVYEVVTGDDVSNLGGASTTDSGCATGGMGGGTVEAGSVKRGPNGEDVNVPYLTQDSTSLKCPDGTSDAGTEEGWFSGKMVMIRLCSVNGMTDSNGRPILVNATAAVNFVAWLDEMSAAGYDVNFNSTFRTMAKQQAIYATSPGNAATPGRSNHQGGLAFDMTLSGSYQRNNCDGKTAEGACIMPNKSALWQDARDIGLKHGLYIHDQEFWHIEFLPSGMHRDRNISVYTG